MANGTALNKINENLEQLIEMMGEIDNRVKKLEKTPRSQSPKVQRVKGTTKPRSSFLGTARKIYVAVQHEKYPKVKAAYCFDGKNWEERTFWGKRKMDKHDWAMYKLHGEFNKAESVPAQ